LPVAIGSPDLDALNGVRWDAEPRVSHPSVEVRKDRGQIARDETPRQSHAAFVPGPDRRDPVALLESQSEGRVPELVGIRYGRMLASPFAFYRGAALLMAADLAGTPSSGLKVQLCGDAHLSNFGAFGSPERQLIFDINDFDETNPGPFEWDVKRLAASFEIAGRANGFDDDACRATVRSSVRAYRGAMAEFAEMGNLEVWYAHLSVSEAIAEMADRVQPAVLERLQKNAAKWRTRDSMNAAEKLSEVVDGRRRIVSDPPMIMTVEELIEGSAEQIEDSIHQLLRAYRASLPRHRRALLESFEYVHFARKVVGVGSVGKRCWIMLLQGRDDHDPLFLQFKEAGPSVLEEFSGVSQYSTAGERIVAGQRLMQAAPDIFLGWLRVQGADGQTRDFYGRQLRDWKGSVVVEALAPQAMGVYAELCGWTLAHAHARSGDRMAIASYLGGSTKFDKAVADFAARYADQNDLDYAALQGAAAEGRITVQVGS
jgi:uncharacterized protein (DUF2252 family)